MPSRCSKLFVEWLCSGASEPPLARKSQSRFLRPRTPAATTACRGVGFRLGRRSPVVLSPPVPCPCALTLTTSRRTVLTSSCQPRLPSSDTEAQSATHTAGLKVPTPSPGRDNSHRSPASLQDKPQLPSVATSLAAVRTPSKSPLSHWYFWGAAPK